MYIVTFEELYDSKRVDGWIESSRLYEDLDEVKDFLEFLYEEDVRNTIQNVHVWNGTSLGFKTTTKIIFDEE